MATNLILVSTHITKCPECNDELITGFHDKDAGKISITHDAEEKKILKRAEAKGNIDISEGPITCSCGTTTVSFAYNFGGTVVLCRSDKEPITSSISVIKRV